LAQINKEKFAAAINKLGNQDQRNLAIGYMKLVNSDKLHMVDYIKKGDKLPSEAKIAYGDISSATVAGHGGGAMTKRTDYGSYTTIITNGLRDNTNILSGGSVLNQVVKPTTVTQVTAHELLGHGLGYIYGNHNASSTQVDNIFLRSKGVNEYYREKTFHDEEPKVSESEAKEVPVYLRSIN